MKPFRLHTLVALLALSGNVYAASSNPVQLPSPKPTEFSRVERMTDQAKRSRIVEDTQNTFTLLGAEIAMYHGRTDLALNTYLAVLNRTKDPEVAERAMELAISVRDYALANRIYEIWQTIQPEPSPAQRRIAWTRALAAGDSQYVVQHLDEVLQGIDEKQARRLFLMLSQVSIYNRELVKQGNDIIHQAAWRYSDLPEAMVADALFSAANQQGDRLLTAIKQLSQIDPELSPVSRLAFAIIIREQPDVLSKFFKQNDSKKLSVIWQELEIENLIQAKQERAAFARLQELLAHEPSAALYLQAAVQAYQQNPQANDALMYLEKAYQFGDASQKSRAATLASIRVIADKHLDQAPKWIERIASPDFAFDKAVLQTTLAIEQQDWQKAIQHSREAEKLGAQQGQLFEESNLLQLYLYALYQSQAPQKTLSELNRLLKKYEAKPDDNKDMISTILYQRGLLYSDKLNRFYDAVADLRRYLALNPDSASAQNALGYVLLDRFEYIKESEELISKAYQKEPESPDINDSMGWVFFKKGDYKTALMYLEFAYKKKQDPEIATHLGEVYWHLGQQDKAKEMWQQAWEKDKNHPALNDTLLKYKIKF